MSHLPSGLYHLNFNLTFNLTLNRKTSLISHHHDDPLSNSLSHPLPAVQNPPPRPRRTRNHLFSTYTTIITATGYTAPPASLLKLAHEILAAGAARRARGEGLLCCMLRGIRLVMLSWRMWLRGLVGSEWRRRRGHGVPGGRAEKGS